MGRIFKTSDLWALGFGLVVMLIVFGDSGPAPDIGNLDAIFGHHLWPLMDVVYPVASIVFFLLYGRSKGPLKFSLRILWPFALFLAAALMIQIDDVAEAFRHSIVLSDHYWTAARWLYFFIATGAFLTFGVICQSRNSGQRSPR